MQLRNQHTIGSACWLLDKGSQFFRREICRFIASDRKRLSFDDVKLSIHTDCTFSEDFNWLLVYNSSKKKHLLTLNFGLNYQNKAKAKLTNMIKLIRVSSNKTFCVVNQRVFMTTTTLTNITATTHGSIYLDFFFHVRSHKSSKSKHIPGNLCMSSLSYIRFMQRASHCVMVRIELWKWSAVFRFNGRRTHVM